MADLYDKPRPRPPRSTARQDSIRVHNRRRAYLEQHPTYFDSLEHEFADPVLYEALVRRFQTAAEREADGKKKGYSRILEGDLLRGEAKLSRLAAEAKKAEEEEEEEEEEEGEGKTPGPATAIGGDPEDEVTTREQGRERWVEFLRERFVQGADEDFDYGTVDKDSELDVLERQDQEEAWFEDEEPGWDEGSGDGSKSRGDTGIQDF